MISLIYKHKRKDSVVYKFFKSISNQTIQILLLAHERKEGTLREKRYFFDHLKYIESILRG